MTPQWSAPRTTGDEFSWWVTLTFGAIHLGDVQWFGISSDPADAEHFYAHARGRRFGSFSTLDEAKRHVEERCPRIVGAVAGAEEGA